MKHKLATLAFLGLTAFTLSACSTAPSMEKAPKAALSEAAQQALDKAEADAKAAKAKFALWTTTEKALKAAQEAAKAGDSATVIKQAKFASDLAALGIAQLSYPTTELK
jgi:flagellar basal body L-ring protein FlgH